MLTLNRFQETKNVTSGPPQNFLACFSCTTSSNTNYPTASSTINNQERRGEENHQLRNHEDFYLPPLKNKHWRKTPTPLSATFLE